MIQFALNYSKPAAELLTSGRIRIDKFKCPAWPTLIEELSSKSPLYVHFPLRVGLGNDDALDTETRQAADWNKVESLLTTTGTCFVNLHLTQYAHDHPRIPINTRDRWHSEHLAICLVRDVAAVIRRFGAERVIVENSDGFGEQFLPTLFPETIQRVVTETGCGFLLDVSHAQLAAMRLGIDPRKYLQSLPVDRIREVHVSGIQLFDAFWATVCSESEADADIVRGFSGREMDHLPLTPDDWEHVGWVLGHFGDGSWSLPKIVALEYGGVGSPWEALTNMETLATQVPQLLHLVESTTMGTSASSSGSAADFTDI
jgi:hypothetical protein